MPNPTMHRQIAFKLKFVQEDLKNKEYDLKKLIPIFEDIMKAINREKHTGEGYEKDTV